MQKQNKERSCLPSTFYVSKHLWKAVYLLSKRIPDSKEYMRFNLQGTFMDLSKEDLVRYRHAYELLKVERKLPDGTWQSVVGSKQLNTNSEIFNLSSDFKRLNLESRGQKRLGDVILSRWVSMSTLFAEGWCVKYTPKGEAYDYIKLQDDKSTSTIRIILKLDRRKSLMFIEGTRPPSKTRKRKKGRTVGSSLQCESVTPSVLEVGNSEVRSNPETIEDKLKRAGIQLDFPESEPEQSHGYGWGY